MLEYADVLMNTSVTGTIDYYSRKVAMEFEYSVSQEDMAQELRLHLYKAFKKYDETKGGVSTFGVKVITNYVNSIYKNKRKRYEKQHRVTPADVMWDNYVMIEDRFEDRIVVKDFFDRLEQQLHKDQKLVAEGIIKLMRKGNTRSECARELEVSKSHVTQILQSLKETVNV